MHRQLRTLLLSALVFVAVVPAADAGFADRFLPTVDASKGVTATATTRSVRVTFGPKAAKLYRKLAGQTAQMGCGDPSVRGGEEFSTSATPDESFNMSGGLWWTERKLPLEELRKDAGADAIVALPSPDAVPAPGQVGVFDDGVTRAVATLRADGQRLFVSRSAGVFSTNVPALSLPLPIRGLL